MKKTTARILSLIMALTLLTLSACSNIPASDRRAKDLSHTEAMPPSSSGPSESPDRPEQNITLYDSPSYTVFYNQLIDTYFIACGLLFNYEGDYLFDSNMGVDYQQTMDFFAPYHSHPFIQGLEAYVDMDNQYANLSVLFYLAQYTISMSNTGLGIANIRSEVFGSDEEFYTFLDGLKQFYQDTGAKDFFEHSNLHNSQKEYLSEHIGDVPIDHLLSGMESYVSNQTDVFGNAHVHSCSLVSVYKSPNNASSHTIGMNGDMFLTSIQSPLGYDGDFNVTQLFETHLHEALHMYINPGVEKQGQLIGRLSQDKNPADFASSQYVHMPWHRIADEAIVRAVQARIYGIAYNDPDFGYQQIIPKETRAGFQNLDAVYHSLEEYENNRGEYPKIDAYLTKLIECYLGE